MTAARWRERSRTLRLLILEINKGRSCSSWRLITSEPLSCQTVWVILPNRGELDFNEMTFRNFRFLLHEEKLSLNFYPLGSKIEGLKIEGGEEGQD